MSTVYVSLGSNVGDRKAALKQVVELVSNKPGYALIAQSRVYETSPVGGPEQDDYLNCVIALTTDDSPDAVLEKMQRIENDMGRIRSLHWGARTIDIDILFYDGVVLQNDHLTIPHPLVTERLFVLVPLCDIAASLMHPVLQQDMATLKYICEQKQGAEQRITPYSEENI